MRSANFADLRPGDVVEHEDGACKSCRWIILERSTSRVVYAEKIRANWKTRFVHAADWNRWARKARQVEEKEA